ncbi:DUF2510 domain-containing protein [Rhodococcus pyridinivorans]|uniref:DUF2510 domain-containing protein n=1 Tax=Rhodococcus pyridinivorans TaxID=103816 RepID=UPI001E5B22AA|nr:DUF2510 domain-containing protein [Rhodococcus pyridinivorans]MCD5421092.1 DUF2510 domain-containing protein [Rhodococcus pyridinivorans]
MSNDKAPAPAGWYPDPQGGQRYWDGTMWLDFPDPASDADPVEPRSRFRKRVILLTLLVVALAAIGGTVTWKLNHDAQVAAQASALEEAAKREAERVEAERAAQEAADNAERMSRSLSVANIESSIEEMANEHVAKGMYDGPVLSVKCSPVNGGSTDNLNETTTVFECFVGTEDVGGGRMRGYKYHATMNWSSGEFTYGFGAP